MSSSMEESEEFPVFYDRKKLFLALFGDDEELEPESEPEPKSIIFQINVPPIKKRAEFRQLTDNVVKEENFPMEKDQVQGDEKIRESSVTKNEVEPKKEKPYQISTSEGLKFVIKSYKKINDELKEAELEKQKKENQIKKEEIKASAKKRKMKEKETEYDETPNSSSKTSGRKAKEERSPFMTLPKSLSFKTHDQKSKDIKREVNKGKKIIQADNNRLKKADKGKEKKLGGKTEVPMPFIIKKLYEQGESFFVKKDSFFVKQESYERKKEKEFKSGDYNNFWLQNENNMEQKPTSSKKPKSSKEIEGKKPTRVTNNTKEEPDEDNNMPGENIANLIPDTCKKPRSDTRRRRIYEHDGA